MKRYRVYYEKTEKGYVEVFANNEDHAITLAARDEFYQKLAIVEEKDVSYTKAEVKD